MKRVEFKTVDGTILRGDLTIPANAKNAPAVILINGLTFLKEHGSAGPAKQFSEEGFVILSYDHRSWGSSDGMPRQHINLFQQAEDLSDAITYMASLPEVDGDRIAIWGIGHGAGVCIMCGAHDKRAKAVMGTGPFFSGEVDQMRFPPGALEAAWKERRESIGKPTKDPIYVPIFAESAEAAEASPLASIIGSPQGFLLWSVLKPLSDAAGTPWENKLTLESLYWQSKWEPTAVVHQISPRPFFWTAVDAPLLPYYQSQVRAFEKAAEPKQFHALKSLEDSFGGPNLEKNMLAQVDFLKRNV